MKDVVIPYDLPDQENHSFFFIDQRVDVRMEAKLHRHDAWELYYVLQGYGTRTAGDTLQPFAAGDVVLIPPSMHHHWDYAPSSADKEGCIRYLMVAFRHTLVQRCMEVFPELRNGLTGVVFPTEALKFGVRSSRVIRQALHVLPEDEQELLLLRYVNELTVSELSEITGLSRFAVYRKTKTALEHLKKRLRKEDFS